MFGGKLFRFCAVATALLPISSVSGIDLQPDNDDSIKSAASQIAYGMVKYYHGNESGQAVGWLPDPYYWWLAGAMWGELIEYWYYTGDSTYNHLVVDALQAQRGQFNDYEPQNVTKQLGNDDQAFWAFSVLTAAELKFQDPPSGDPGWLALAQAVFNRQASRYDTATCNGGLRWQVFTFNGGGYNYKNSVSNGGFFQIAARLYRYTGNETYLDWAEKVFDWMDGVQLISDDFHVYDGVSTPDNCTSVDHHEWTYNVGMIIAGSAYLYNKTQDQKWLNVLSKSVTTAQGVFFQLQNEAGPALSEVSCEPYNTCNNEQPSFKGYLARWMALATQMAPSLRDQIMPDLRSSAVGAAGQCSGGTDGITCGLFWNQTQYDGHYGVAQQMSALAVVMTLLIDTKEPPVSQDTGGTSQGNPGAGTENNDPTNPYANIPITTADKAGAGIVTALMIILTLGGSAFMVL